jgi:hypothetical protein
MVQFNIGGITLGTQRDHWWDYLTPFDTFTGANGSAPDSSKWDTAVAGTNPGTVTIQNNTCILYNYAPASTSTNTSSATLILKNAITSGKILLIFTPDDKYAGEEYDYGQCYTQVSVGNDTDGWTVIETTNLTLDKDSDDTTATANSLSSSIEAIYQGNNNWNIYIGNNPYASNPKSLPNGLKVKIYSYTQGGDNTSNSSQYFYINTAYIL